MANTTIEDMCRELLALAGVKDADQYTSGDLVGMANRLGEMLVKAKTAGRVASIKAMEVLTKADQQRAKD